MVQDSVKKHKKHIKKVDDSLKEFRQQALDEMASEMEAQIHKEIASGLISREAAIKRWMHDTEEKLKSHESLFILLQGFDLINTYRQEALSKDEISHLEKDSKKCRSLEEIKTIMAENKEQSEPSILQKSLGISDFMMTCFHKIAYKLFEMGNLEEAKSVFLVLANLNPFVSAYFNSLAIICLKMGNRKDAIGYATFAATIDKEDIHNHLLLGTLLLENGDRAHAKEEVAKAEKLIAKGGKHDKADAEDLRQLKLAVH